MLQNVKTLIAIEVLLVIGMMIFRAALRPGDRDVVDARVVGVTLLTPAVGLLAGNAFLYYAYLALTVAFIARSRAELCSFYLLMLPMTPLLSLETAAGGAYLLPLSALVAMNVGALLGVMVTPGGRRLAIGRADAGAILLILLFIFIYGRDVSVISIVRSVIVFVIAFAGPYLLISRGIATRADYDRALLRLTLAAVMAAVVAMFETGRHWILYQSFNDALHVPIQLQSATLGMRGGRLRTGGPLVDYSVAGVFFATALMLLPYLKARLRADRFWIVAGVIGGGLFVTQSRGAWIGAAIGFAAILVYRGRVWRAVSLALAALLLRAVLFLSLSDSSRLAETFGKAGGSTGTVTYRRTLLWRGLDQIVEHPLAGQSPKQLVASLPDLVQGQHIVDFVNSHLFVAMVAGVPGFLVWLGVWMVPVVAAWRVRRAAPVGANPAEVPFGMVIAVMVSLTATSIVDRNVTWATIALALVGPATALAGARRGGRVRRATAAGDSAGGGALVA